MAALEDEESPRYRYEDTRKNMTGVNQQFQKSVNWSTMDELSKLPVNAENKAVKHSSIYYFGSELWQKFSYHIVNFQHLSLALN